MRGRRFGGKVSASRPGAFPVFLVAVALLFCHGAFGYAHQASLSGVQGAHDNAHMVGVQQPDPGDDLDRVHPGGAYFAILLALLFGAFLLPAGGALVAARHAGPSNPRWSRGPRFLPPPRGPTLPSLQVFRL